MNTKIKTSKWLKKAKKNLKDDRFVPIEEMKKEAAKDPNQFEPTFAQKLADAKHTKIYSHDNAVPEYSSSDGNNNLEGMGQREKEIFLVTRHIKKSFRDENMPPPTKEHFYKIGRILGKGAFGKVNQAMHKLSR